MSGADVREHAQRLNEAQRELARGAHPAAPIGADFCMAQASTAAGYQFTCTRKAGHSGAGDVHVAHDHSGRPVAWWPV